MITKERLEGHLRKVGYTKKDTKMTEWYGLDRWQYKDLDMYCHVWEDKCVFFDDQGLGNDLFVVYSEWEIDEDFGHLRKVK